MIKIIFSNIRGRLFNCIILTAVLTVTLFSAVSPVKNVADMLADESFYRQSGLEDVYYFDAGGRDVRTVCDSIKDDLNLIGAGYNSAVTKDGFSEFTPVGSGFFENLDFSYKKRLKDFGDTKGFPAVVCKSLGSYYALGETYTEGVRIGFNEMNLTFTVVGILSGDRGYFYSWRGIRKADNFVYIVTDGSADHLYDDGEVYFTADSLDDAKSAVSKALGEQFEVKSVAEDYKTVRGVTLENLNVPIILTATSFLLSFCMMLSHSFLSAASYRKKYAVLFACGCTRKRLLLIHVLSDFVPALAAVLITAILTVINILRGDQLSILRQYTLSGLAAVVLEAAVIFAAVEAISAKTVMGSLNVGLADER